MNAENFVMLAAAKSEKGDYKGAIDDYTQALLINPNHADAYFQRGLVRLQQGEYQRAIEDFNWATRFNPNHAEAYCFRGRIRSALRDNQRAIEDFNRTIRINANHADTYFHRGTARSELGYRQEAIKDFLKAAVLYLKQGDTDDYQETLECLRTELNVNVQERNQNGVVTFEGGSGDTIESAIIIKGATNGTLGLQAEYQYLTQKFGQRGIDWDLENQSLLRLDRYCDEMHIQLADGTQTVIFFDITDFYGKGDEDFINSIMRNLNLNTDEVY